MVEPAMYIGIGFLLASLLALVIIPLVHDRAVRLTLRRVDTNMPLSQVELQAHKDHLRAEIAVTACRLEMNVKELKTKIVCQLAELGKKTDTIKRLKVELAEKTTAIFALDRSNNALQSQLRVAEDIALNGEHADRLLASKLASLTADRDARSILADSRRIEIVALKTEIETLKDRLALADRPRSSSRQVPGSFKIVPNGPGQAGGNL
jgi:hypothetical protein